jgi:hypothetical protein
LDLELELAAPVDEGGLGDVQLGHEPGIGPALGPEFDELLNRFLIFHVPFRGPSGRSRWDYPSGPLPFESAKRGQTDVIKRLHCPRTQVRGPIVAGIQRNLRIQWIQWSDGIDRWMDSMDAEDSQGSELMVKCY